MGTTDYITLNLAIFQHLNALFKKKRDLNNSFNYYFCFCLYIT